jgi:hypothetical protein
VSHPQTAVAHFICVHVHVIACADALCDLCMINSVRLRVYWLSLALCIVECAQDTPIVCYHMNAYCLGAVFYHWTNIGKSVGEVIGQRMHTRAVLETSFL